MLEVQRAHDHGRDTGTSQHELHRLFRIKPTRRKSLLDEHADSPLIGFGDHGFVRLIFDRRREEVLLSVSEAFRQRSLQERGVVEGVVECARPLDDTELSDLAADLGQRLGKQVSLTTRPNSELVGGVRVIVGASMIDQSVQGRLDGLRRRLQEARLSVG